MVIIAILALVGGFKPSEKMAVPIFYLQNNLSIEGEGVAYVFGGVETREQTIEPKNFAVIQVEVTNKLDSTIYPNETIKHNPDLVSSEAPPGKIRISRAGGIGVSNGLGSGLSANFEIEKSGERKFYLFDVQPTPAYRGFVNANLPEGPIAEVRF